MDCLWSFLTSKHPIFFGYCTAFCAIPKLLTERTIHGDKKQTKKAHTAKSNEAWGMLYSSKFGHRQNSKTTTRPGVGHCVFTSTWWTPRFCWIQFPLFYMYRCMCIYIYIHLFIFWWVFHQVDTSPQLHPLGWAMELVTVSDPQGIRFGISLGRLPFPT